MRREALNVKGEAGWECGMINVECGIVWTNEEV